MPFAVMREIASLVPLPAVEVLVTRDGRDLLLTYRKDDFWNGWHVPGGYVACEEPFEAACTRITRRELGIEVRMYEVLDAFVWLTHPYASTISILCLCRPLGQPREGEFFTVAPDPMVANHDRIVQRFWDRR